MPAMLAKIAWAVLLGSVALLAIATALRPHNLTAAAYDCSRHGEDPASIRACVDQEILRLIQRGCLKSVFPRHSIEDWPSSC
jgi:hypothetical protein